MNILPARFSLPTVGEAGAALTRGLLVGLAAGLVVGLFRWTHDMAYAPVHAFALHRAPLMWWLALVLVGVAVSRVMEQLPQTRSSGIPVVESALAGDENFPWRRILWAKFVSTWLMLMAGLSVGREGPCIEMGAAAGLGVANGLRRIPTLALPETDVGVSPAHNPCVMAGAGAGLSAAFGAPLGGIAFVLEEMRCNPAPTLLIGLLTAAFVSDAVLMLFGLGRMFPFEHAASMPLAHYWQLIPVGLCLGLAGAGYNSILLMCTRAYKTCPFPAHTQALPPVLMAGVLLFYGPKLLAGGEVLILAQASATASQIPTLLIGLLLLGKFCFSILCASSSVPGGLLMPMLCLGGMLGSLFLRLTGTPAMPEEVQLWLILGMSGFFAASVRAPVTGAALTIQMTGAYSLTPEALIVAFVAGKCADQLKSEPIYEALRKGV